MQNIDRRLRGKGFPNQVSPRDISREIKKMNDKLDQFRDSTLASLGRKNEQSADGSLSDAIELKPGIWGFSFDLKKLWRWCISKIQLSPYIKDKIVIDNYSKKEIIGIFKNENWQELYDFFRNLYDPLSLREFRGYVEYIAIDDYACHHWLSSSDKKGFGELMISYAVSKWNNFKIKFYDSSDEKRFLKLDINCNENKIVLVGSLDNKEKLDNVFREIIGILGVQINKSKDIEIDSKFRFYNKWWFKFLLAPLIVGTLLFLLQQRFSNKQKNNLQNLSVKDINNSSISGDIVGGDKITYQTAISIPVDQMNNIDKENKIKISRVKILRIIEDLSSNVNEIKKEYFKGNEQITKDFNSRGMVSSGVYIKSQMDFAISTKANIEKLLTKAHRDIEDVLLENFSITNLAGMDEFSEEDKRLSELEKNIIPTLYKQLEDVVRNQEIRVLGTTQITKDFKL